MQVFPSVGHMEIILPDYSGGSIFNISQTIKTSLGLKHRHRESSVMSFAGKPISLVVLDGLGLDLALASGVSRDTEGITSVFPSITATALTTLMSGELPGEHSVLGDSTFVRRLGSIINNGSYRSIYCDEKDSLSRYLPINEVYNSPNIIAEATSNGMKCAVISPYQWENAAFARLSSSPAGEHFYYSDFEGAISLYNNIMKRNYDYIYFYIPYIDISSHKLGPGSTETLQVARQIINSVTRVSMDHTDKYTTIITADHGHIRIDKWVNLELDNMNLGKDSIPLFGSPRSLFMNYSDEQAETLRATLSESSIFKATDQNLRKLLGSSKCMKKTMFTHLAGAISHSSYYYPISIANGSSKIIGDHGGLTREEMIVPCITIE